MSSDGSRRYPERPIIGVGGILFQDERVLLVKRGRPPLQGAWSLPGGVLEVGELLADGLRREILEETGLEVRLLKLVEIFERIIRDAGGRPEYHYVLIDYLCEKTGGELRAGDDVVSVEWVEQDRLPDYDITSGTADVIRKAWRSRSLSCSEDVQASPEQ